jgi:hypothetical protein
MNTRRLKLIAKLDRLLDILGGCPESMACKWALTPVRCERNRGHDGPHTASCPDRVPHVWIGTESSGRWVRSAPKDLTAPDE